MNEEALKDAYNQFANTGYDGDQNEFYTLLPENSEAFADSYGLFKGSGYDGSEDDYKTLLGLKKKDVSVVSSIPPQTGSEDTPLQSELSQPSLEETSQNSLEERFSGYMDMPDEDKFKLAKQEDKRPFYESQGVDYDKFLLAKQEEEEVISTNEEQKEEDEESSWAGKWYDRLSNWSEYDEEQTELAEKDTSSRMYLAKNKEGIKSADLDYDNALFQSIIKNSKSSKQFAKAIQESGIDQNNIRMPEMQIDGQDASMNEWIDYWLDSDNVSTQKSIAEENEDYDEAVNGGMDPEEASEKFLKTKAPNYSITVDENFSDNPNYKSLEYAKNLMNRQLESGGMIGDWGQNLLATTIDLGAGLIEQMEKVPAGLGLKPSPLADAKKFENLSSWELYMQEGGYYANKVQGYANQVRELTRIPEEQSIAESFLEGNYSDVLFNAGNGVANAIPFTLAVAATGGGTAGLILGGASAGGMKSLELKERRRGGEDIDNWQIHFSEGVTAVSEGFFEKYTQGIIRSARKAGGLKAISDPNVLLDSYLKGIKKAILTEVPSEVATEATQYLSDVSIGLEEFDAGEFAVRMVDTAIISTLFGGGTYVTVRGAKEISRNLGVINKNTSVIFTNEKGEKKEMSRGEAVNLARDPEIAQQIRDGKLKVDYSMNDVAREAIDNLVYGESAPDAIAARSVMRNKEKAVQEILDKVQSSKKVDEKTGKEVNDVSTEDLKSLSEAVTEMEAEGKVSKYNESETTVATRKKVQAILKEKGIEITNATQTQDVSTSKVTNTTEVNKINTEEEYNNVKKQIKSKRIPKVVTSETQKGITVKGEVVQESEVTQGKFKNIAAAKNAVKDYEAKANAAKEGMMVEDDLFPANNKLFIKTNKETLDEVPQEVLDSKEYYVLTSEKEGLTAEERSSRMVELKSDLDKAGAKYYTVQGVYNGVAEESLVVTGVDEAQALTIGRQFGQESIFSAEKGLMFSSGAVVPLNGDAVEGVDARKRDALTIMNVGGKKVSLHTGLDWGKMSYGKNFNSDNIHRLDDSDPNYDKELFEGVTEDRKRALGFAFKLLNSIGGLNVTVVRNSAAMAQQLEALGQDPANSRGSFFRAADKTIYVNLETVQGNTLFHEIIHPMVDFIKVNDAALYSRIEQEVTDSNVKRRTTLNGKKMKGSYLEWAEVNYANLSREGQIEEAFAEMMGDAAYGHFKNRQSKLNRLRGVITAMLNKLGMTSLPENVEAIDLATMSLSDMNENLVGAFLDGRKITVGGVEFEVGETDAEPKFQLDAVDRRTGIQYTYDKNSKVFAEMEADGRITSGKTIQDFSGKKMMIHAPDAMFSGSIIDADGTILVEGKGGIMYPFVFNEEGYFWASTDNTAEKMAEQLNSMMDENDGKIYMALTTATQDKLLSSTAASRGILNLFSSENFIKKIGMNKSQLYKSVIEAANNVSTVTKTKIDKKTGEEVKSTKKVGLDLNLKAYRASSNFTSDVVEKIWSKLDNSTSSFDDRKNFSDKLLTNIKKFKVLESGSSKVNFVNFINTTDPSLDYSKFNKDGSGNITSLKKAIINVLTEPSLREKDGDTNRIYAVLEMDGPVKAINTKENPNVPDYESYGTAIVSDSGNRAKIHRLDNREFWYDVAEDPMTNTVIGETTGRSGSGQISSRRSQIMPSMAGVSTTPLKISNDIRFQAPSYDMEYTPNALVSLSMIDLEKANTTEWISKLSKGVKGTSKDIATMGLEDILKAYQKESKVKSIPKEVVAQLIATNMAEIETKILSKNPVINYDDYYVGYDGDTYGITTPEGLILNSGVEVTTEVEELSDNERKDIIEEGLDGLLPVSKYSEVTLPGGDNYREFLIRSKSSEEIFTAPHYDEFGENLIASVRADDRVGPNGEKILFVQEIQSDWVQGTNKGDFKTKDEVKELEDQIDALQKEMIDLGLSDKFKDNNLESEFEKEHSDLSNKRRDLVLRVRSIKPHLPWNQTDLWVGLAIRKIINQASKEGYDQVAFVNGEQSDIVQGHTGGNKGRTSEFYNNIVPKNINNELKRLVKGMKYGVKGIFEFTSSSDIRNASSIDLYLQSQKNAVINLTPELKAATDKVGPLRFQKPLEEGETNDYTDGSFTIGWDISKVLQDTDYAAGTYLSGLIDQKSFKSKERQRYDIRLTTLLAKPFGTHSDKEVKEIMARSRGSLNAELLEANLIKRRLEKANKEANLSPEEINDLLHNLNDIKAMEDSDIKMALLEMRAQVDRLSNTLISEGLIDGQTMFTVDANLGFYITKSYKNFEVKGWKQTDNLIIKKAKDFLYKEAKKDNPKASEDKLLNIVDESFRKLTEDKEFSYNMKGNGSLDGLTRVTSIFKEKKVIPQEIKDLWGEIDNPLFNYNNTVKKLAQTVSAERMYRDILEIGEGRFISDSYDRNSTTNELKGAKWGALDGKFVDNEMFSVMNQMNPESGEGSFRWVYDFYMNMVLFNKKMKTVWNPGTHIKNIVGNTAFATMNGHLNPLNPQMYKDGITSIKTVTGMKTPELQELYKKLTAKGVVSSSASLEEIRGIAKDLAQSDFDLSEYLDENNGKVQKLAAKAKRAVGKPYNYLDKKFSKAYQAEDDVWKIFGYLSEKARYVKAGLTEKEADDMAARNIINLYPNYAEIPRAIRIIGRSPLIGSFVAFQAESFRNSKNVVMLGFQEISSNNPKIRKIGATRIAGTIATMALLEGLQLYTLQFLSESLGLSGGDEEESEQRKIRTLVADWDKSGSLGYVDSGSLDTKTNEDQMENDKYFDYINFSSISGVGYIKDIMRLAFEDIETQAGKESSFRVMEQIFAPFIGEEMTLSAMQEAYANQGGKVYNRTDDSLTKLSKMVMFVGNQIKPGVASSGVRIYNSMDEDSDRVPLYETMALFGLRINRGNANKSLAINARAAYNDMRERTDDNILRSKSLLQKELLVNPDLDNDLSIISDLMAAARLNKVAGEDTRTILKGMGVSNIVIDLAYNRMIKNYMQDVLSVDAK